MRLKKKAKRELDPVHAIDLEDGRWRTCFAFIPKLIDGYYVWLEHVEYRWNAETNQAWDGHFPVLLGDWEYRLIP